MNYLPPFAYIRQEHKITAAADRDRATLRYRDFIEIVKLFLRGVAVDAAWYLAQYPDVADAIKAGTFKSAKHHFVENGYFEGRLPAEFHVDEAWYLTAYPDVADGIGTGEILSATEHFLTNGYAEGRLPSEY